MSSDGHDVNRRDVAGLWTAIILMPLLRVAFRATSFARRFLRWEGAPWDWAILVSAIFLAWLTFAT